MRAFINKQPIIYKKLFAVIFMAGFMAGIIYANLIGTKYADSSGILSEYFLSRYKYFEIESNNLFWYLFGERILPCFVLWLTGITAIGILAVWGYLAWIGFSGGMLISMAVMKYGVKGLVLCVGGVLPQYLVYIPVLLMLLQKVYDFALAAVGEKNAYRSSGNVSKKQMYMHYIWFFLIIAAFMTAGIVLESYINPVILKIVLKSF